MAFNINELFPWAYNSPSTTGWSRPAGWPVMPVSSADRIDILARVNDDDSNFCALSVTVVGGYTVDWGDGTTENVASGVQVDHEYTYSTLPSSSGVLAYKTVLIRVYPQATNSITAFDLGLKNAASGPEEYTNPWLEIQVNTPACVPMLFRGGV